MLIGQFYRRTGTKAPFELSANKKTR